MPELRPLRLEEPGRRAREPELLDVGRKPLLRREGEGVDVVGRRREEVVREELVPSAAAAAVPAGLQAPFEVRRRPRRGESRGVAS